MSANLRIYTQALYGFDHVVRLTPGAAWERPSPCGGWTGRDVIGHVIAVQRWIESLARQTEPTLNPYEDPGRNAGDGRRVTRCGAPAGRAVVVAASGWKGAGPRR